MSLKRAWPKPLPLVPHRLALLILGLSLVVGRSSLGLQREFQQHNNIFHFKVPENAPNNTFVGNIRSSLGHLPYVVVPINSLTPELELKHALYLNLTNGNIYTNRVLDREQREHYTFIALTSESAQEIKCTVTVTDINDNVPTFVSANETILTSIVFDVPENQKGVRRQLPLAVDADSPQFSIKEFRMMSDPINSGLFFLVEHSAPVGLGLNNSGLNTEADMSSLPSTKEDRLLAQEVAVLNHALVIPSQSPGRVFVDIELIRPLDRETQSSYQLVVEAMDGGSPPLIGRLAVTINVLDENDNSPKFIQKPPDCVIREDAVKGTILGTVQATDADADLNGQVSYFIKHTISSSPPFGIDPTKGEIYLTHTLDYESEQRYVLEIEARDHGKPSRSSSTTVRVLVSDVQEEQLPPKRMASSPSSESITSPIDNQQQQQQQQQRSTGNLLGSVSLLFDSNPAAGIFVIVLSAVCVIACVACLLKTNSHQPESDYNDTAGLTMTPNNGQTKPSPNHSISNEHFSNGSIGNEINHHRHHDLLGQRRQLPPTPSCQPGIRCLWAQGPESTIGYCPGSLGHHGTPGSTLECVPPLIQPVEGSLLDLAASRSHLNHVPSAAAAAAALLELDGPYNWDYLMDWTPGYSSMMELLQSESGSRAV